MTSIMLLLVKQICQSAITQVRTIKMENAISMIIQKSNYNHAKQLRTLVLSTNVNDYDTGETIVDGNIRKTLTCSQIVDNPILSELNGAKVGRKYLGQQNNDFLMKNASFDSTSSEDIEKRRALILKETRCRIKTQELIVNSIVVPSTSTAC
jgi:hypothetical protein